MPNQTEVATAVYAAYRLARGDASAIEYFDATLSGFWKSFFAAVLIAPFYLMLLFGRHMVTASDAIEPLRFYPVEMIGYVLAWVTFPLVMIPLADALDRRKHFFRFLVAYNWSSVLQQAVMLPISYLLLGGIIPGELAGPLHLIIVGAILFYIWFITRTALELPGITAAGIVFIAFVIDYIIIVLTASMH